MNLFVYGTLKEREILSDVLGRDYTGSYEPATLRDYVLKRPNFYMVFPKKGSSVEGLIVSELSTSDFMKLDVYESIAADMYRRTMAWVDVVRGGEKVPMLVFVYYNGSYYKLEE